MQFNLGGNAHFFAQAVAAFLDGRWCNAKYACYFLGVEIDAIIRTKFLFA